MGQDIYERPREKLRNKGVISLTRVELLQLIIGPGNARTPGARIARSINQLIDDGDVAYGSLLATSGVGEAKACQLLAAFELARRWGIDE